MHHGPEGSRGLLTFGGPVDRPTPVPLGGHHAIRNPDPFHSGQDAFVMSVGRDQSPYPLQSPEGKSWLEGWDDAQALYEEELANRSATNGAS